MLRFGVMLMMSLCVGMLVGLLFRRGDDISLAAIIINTLSFHGAIIVLVPFFLREHAVGWSDAFGFASPRQVSTLCLSIGVAIVTFPIIRFLGEVSVKLMTMLRLEPVAQQAVTTLQQTTEVGPQIYMAIMAVGVAPVAEEILFRGILYPFVKRDAGALRACLLLSMLFGAVHLTLMAFLPLTFLAIALTWLYERTNNLVAPILVHSFFNLANFFWLVLKR
jgi:membrane protease YdiL (CAAX protease family)